MVDKKVGMTVPAPTNQELDEMYRQMAKYQRERDVYKYAKNIAPRGLPSHRHRWTDPMVASGYVDKLERELRDAQRRIEELEAPRAGPDLLTPMRHMAAKFDVLEKSLYDAPHTANAMWNELFSRKGRFLIYEHALKDYPRLVMSAVCGVFPLRTEYAYESAAFDITGVSLYFKPIGLNDQIPRYELEFTNIDNDAKDISFRWR